jgi:hypothetical protein
MAMAAVGGEGKKERCGHGALVKPYLPMAEQWALGGGGAFGGERSTEKKIDAQLR